VHSCKKIIQLFPCTTLGGRGTGITEPKAMHHSFTICDNKLYSRNSPKISLTLCDRTTLKIRGLSSQDRSRDSRRNENAQTHIRNIQIHD
jgi:hypothetical protein